MESRPGAFPLVLFCTVSTCHNNYPKHARYTLSLRCCRGRNPDDGSEHYLEGRQYPLEIHFVHVNNKYENISVALESGNKDALLVVGQMFKVDENATESYAIKELTRTGPVTSRSAPLKATDLLDACEFNHPHPALVTSLGQTERQSTYPLFRVRPLPCH